MHEGENEDGKHEDVYRYLSSDCTELKRNEMKISIHDYLYLV